MTTIADEPIHPCQELDASGMPRHQMHTGLSLRQYYAGLAMQGYRASLTEKDADTDRGSPKYAAQVARKLADALIEELENTK